MWVLFRKALRDVTQRRTRSLLTLLGIVVGVSGIVAIVSTGQNLAQAQQAAYASASQADVSLWLWDAPNSTEPAIERIDNVSAAELRVDFFTRCHWPARVGTQPEFADVSLHGVQDFQDMRVDQITLVAGRFPLEGEIVAEETASQAAPIASGDTVTCRGRSGNADQRLSVVGLIRSPNYPSAAILNYLTFYAPSSEIKKLLGTPGSNGLIVKLYDLGKARDTSKEVTQLLDRRGIPHGPATVRDPQNYLGKRELDALLLLLFAFSAVGVGTSGFLVANTLAAIIAEQVGEIGMIKALGGTRGQVLFVYLAAAALYGIVGTSIGLLAGVLLSWRLFAFIGSLLSLAVGFEIAPLGLLLGVIVGMGVTLLSGAIPSIAATYIPVKQALESRGITSTYGIGWSDRLIKRLVTLPPLGAMSLRNLARRKGRTVATVIVIAIAVAVSLSAQSVSASVDSAIDDLFEMYRADAWVYFGENVSTAFESQLHAMPFIREVETWSLQDAWITIPGRSPSTSDSGTALAGSLRGSDTVGRARLWGLPAETTLYQPNLLQGRWYQPDENDAAVISSDLAESQAVQLGQVIKVDTGNEARWFRVVGIAQDNSVFLGSQVAGKVFMREDLVAGLEHRTGYATFFAVSLDVRDPTAVESRLEQIAARFSRYQVSSDSAVREVRSAKEQTRVLTIALAAMSILVGIIGALAVLNTLTLNVLERRREIGILRTIGGTDRNLIETFLTEGLAFGLGGWVLGVGLGFPLGLILLRVMESVLFQIPYIYNARMILASLVFALALSVTASLVPAMTAARLKAGQVLRYE